MDTNMEQIAVQSVFDIDAANIAYRELNTMLRDAVVSGTQKLVIRNVQGQRYIGTNLGSRLRSRYTARPAMTWALSWMARGSLFTGMRKTAVGAP